MRIDRRYLNLRITVVEAYRDPCGQDGAKRQEAPRRKEIFPSQAPASTRGGVIARV